VRFLLVLLILAALASGGYYGYQRLNSGSEEISYKTAEVRRGNIVATVSATGNIEPLVKVLVGSQVSGTVVRWYADFNQQVTAGFVLAELDKDRYAATLAQRSAASAVARALVEESAARLSKTRLDLARLSVAMSRNAASEFEMRTAETEVQAAEAALHAAEAQVLSADAERRSAEIELEKTIIKSPIDGVVISRSIDAGQTVAASLQAPTLFTIANDLKKMRVNAAVSETDIGKIAEGMPAEFRVDAFPGRKFRGVVSQVRYAETIVDNVVTYTTLIDVDNSDLLLRPGMTATILFEVARADDVLIVPNAALRFDPVAASAAVDWNRPGRGRPRQPRVFRLDSTGKPAEVTVEPGLNDGAVTQIAAGSVKEGDAVVTEQIGGAVKRPSGPPMGQAAGSPRGPRM
jgi:HlyD family secretion protein